MVVNIGGVESTMNALDVLVEVISTLLNALIDRNRNGPVGKVMPALESIVVL